MTTSITGSTFPETTLVRYVRVCLRLITKLFHLQNFYESFKKIKNSTANSLLSSVILKRKDYWKTHMRKQHQVAFPSAAENKEKKESGSCASSSIKAEKDHGLNMTHHHSTENTHGKEKIRSRGGHSSSSHHHDKLSSK